MAKEREYQELYDRLIHEVSTLHQTNRRRIRNGMRMLVAVTLGLMLLMFLAEGNKVFTLMLWILSMFTVAAYLIAVEYADYELQKKIEDITQREQESFGALLERLLDDPAKLAGDLDALSRALQGLSRDLRRGETDGGKEDVQ